MSCKKIRTRGFNYRRGGSKSSCGECRFSCNWKNANSGQVWGKCEFFMDTITSGMTCNRFEIITEATNGN